MNENQETFSIDLTEDDIELPKKKRGPEDYNTIEYGNTKKLALQNNDKLNSTSVSQINVLTKYQDGVLAEKIIQSPLRDSQDQSTIDFLENMEKENPQIETVFIESDEDDNTIQEKSTNRPQIKIHNMVVINSEKSISETQSSLLNVKSIPEVASTNTSFIPINRNLHQASSARMENKNVSFRVRAISPSKFNKNLSKNSSTISLRDETAKSSKKYLVIPKEVAPLLVNKEGPILLDIPDIGRVLIQKPSDIFKSHSTSFVLPAKSQEPNCEQVLPKSTANKPAYDPLTDSKYCWRYLRNRKRDWDGLTVSDRLGFYKAEQKRTKMCAVKYQDILKRLQSSINMKERALMAISTRLNMENVKLVEIDSIRKGKKRILLQNKHHNPIKAPRVSPLTAKPKRKQIVASGTGSVSPIQLSSESDNSQPGTDLLVTKKVVFINETEHPRGRKRKRHKLYDPYRTKKLQKRDESDKKSIQNQLMYQAISSLKEKITSDKSLSGKNKKKNKVGLHKSNLPALPSDKGTETTQMESFEKLTTRHSKRSTCSTMEVNQGVHEVKPCYVEIPHNNLVQKALDNYNSYTRRKIRDLVHTCKVIDTLKQFQEEIQPIKPILVINENHCVTMNFKESFCKNNIVFPMTENTDFLNFNITNSLFVESAKAGYIKFVKSRILCRYLAGFRDP